MHQVLMGGNLFYIQKWHQGERGDTADSFAGIKYCNIFRNIFKIPFFGIFTGTSYLLNKVITELSYQLRRLEVIKHNLFSMIHFVHQCKQNYFIWTLLQYLPIVTGQHVTGYQTIKLRSDLIIDIFVNSQLGSMKEQYVLVTSLFVVRDILVSSLYSGVSYRLVNTLDQTWIYVSVIFIWQTLYYTTTLLNVEYCTICELRFGGSPGLGITYLIIQMVWSNVTSVILRTKSSSLSTNI